MARKAAEILIDTIHDWAVDTVFGVAGDGTMEALRQRRDRIRFVQVRHEEAAACMAGGLLETAGGARSSAHSSVNRICAGRRKQWPTL